jgi:hypothetical protein
MAAWIKRSLDKLTPAATRLLAYRGGGGVMRRTIVVLIAVLVAALASAGAASAQIFFKSHFHADYDAPAQCNGDVLDVLHFHTDVLVQYRGTTTPSGLTAGGITFKETGFAVSDTGERWVVQNNLEQGGLTFDPETGTGTFTGVSPLLLISLGDGPNFVGLLKFHFTITPSGITAVALITERVYCVG